MAVAPFSAKAHPVLVVLRRWYGGLRILALALAVQGCSDDGDPSPSAPRTATWLDELSGELPPTIGELGLYPKLPDLGVAHSAATRFRPRHELWSNGTAKQRFLVLPPGSAIDNGTRDAWSFPSGTVLLKTFSAPRVDTAGELGPELPLETRVLRRQGDTWEYAVYLWNEAGSDAELADLARSHAVTVEIEGERFAHVVPSKLDCRKCHESHPPAVIGLSELGLTAPYDDGERSQLEVLHERGLLGELPNDPEVIEHPDPATLEVLGYLQGNCAHCHNGGDGPSSAFDLRHEAALDNLIGRETQGEALAGTRVVPGEPDESVVYLALSRAEDAEDIQAMPPVGVQRVDAAAVELFQHWIEDLDE